MIVFILIWGGALTFIFVIDQDLLDQLKPTTDIIKKNYQKIATEVCKLAQNNPNNSFALQIEQSLQENTIGETLVKELKLEASKGKKGCSPVLCINTR